MEAIGAEEKEKEPTMTDNEVAHNERKEETLNQSPDGSPHSSYKEGVEE